MKFLGKEYSKYNPFIIAEISCNHEGRLDKGFRLIENAKDAGADAVKIQHYYPEEMTFKSMNDPFLIKEGPWEGNALFDLYQRNALTVSQVDKLFDYAKLVGIPMFSSVFGAKSLKDLEAVGCPAYKIASFECCDPQFINRVSLTDKPLIVSTGVSDWFEINQAINNGRNKIQCLMHCVSSYPTDREKANLDRIGELRWKYPHLDIGYSDHTCSFSVAPIAVALGASMIEAHLGLGSETSDDADFSFDANSFYEYVGRIREAAMLLKPSRQSNTEKESYQYKRHMFASRYIYEGETLNLENCVAMRGKGNISPAYFYNRVYTAERDYNPGEPIDA